MATIPVVVLAGQSNAAFGGVDNRLYEVLAAGGSDFELVKVAVDWTSLFANPDQDWDPASGELFAQLVAATKAAEDRVRASGNEPVVYTLWMQGEIDVGTPGYDAKLADFIGQYRSAIGQPTSTFGISLLPYASDVRSAQLAVAAATPNVLTVETLGATTWDGMHYDKAWREKIAQDFLAQAAVTTGSSAGYDNGLAAAKVWQDGAITRVIGPQFVDYTWNNGSHATIIQTFSGDDTVITGAFIDTIRTGDNNDTVWSGGGNDFIDLGMHDDVAHAGTGNDRVIGGFGNDQIWGDEGDDWLQGVYEDDTIRGGAGNDRIDGGEGDDRLLGDDGNDTIVMGPGRDVVTGGAGADRFVFVTGETPEPGRSGMDTITDFSARAGDVIDLSAIDANVLVDGDQAFQWIGAGKFTGHAGELQAVAARGFTLIAGDTDGDGRGDVWIRLTDVGAIDPAGIVL
ncbi:sialate O-acetylesterase [Novosphingobium cyanobacteriorum]|uniref:Sialate O-acetylesterase n=1 Tax=Novosphingobium cyanobacteriorum TaxID=3024215 RepID=A0ABT6CKE6_9SPHN|nr:sialate O-acetylesterase [Novosphingobium cyanobacteriorum]MDF8334404.1 sialate O-acetylesterase [Novosphingobium cyanobacteriorum]